MSTSAFRARASIRAAQRQPDGTARPLLTGRAAVLLLVVALLVYTLAIPVRSLIMQRTALAAQTADNDAARGRIAALTAQSTRLSDPAYLATLIRARLQYVRPGEIGYVVLGPQDAPAPAAVRAEAARAWYVRLWRSVEAVDRSGRLIDSPITIRPDAPR